MLLKYLLTSALSLDELLHQILMAEQHNSVQSQQLKKVKAAIIRCNSQVKAATEKYLKITEELEAKSQQLSTMKLLRHLLKKCDEQISKQCEELLSEKARLQERLARMRAAFKDEEQEFLREISTFNGEFNLCGSTEATRQTHAEVLGLDMEVDALCKDSAMEKMIQRNRHMGDLQRQKRSVRLELQALKSIHADLEQQLSEAKEITATLQARNQAAAQKVFTDDAVVTMRKELEMHQEGDMELLLETLRMEVQHLQSKVDNCKGRQQP
ncbi:coiled-coil domain-containing protein 172-like isoform X2 [Hippocampus comes]|uniref:coiled-coil domain-containing protein 172-like isoform X2 n=1 Tax=Hippocampus comes TaxID=109280 RepID=UPI00094E366C|nr:PREDICTED: coiled-coil domain-containing protein 172-like isoform X2 [Hippocampus comes]